MDVNINLKIIQCCYWPFEINILYFLLGKKISASPGKYINIKKPTVMK